MTDNVLTSLASDVYRAADLVGRELAGFISGATINGGAEGAAMGEVIRSSVTPTATSTPTVPSNVSPNTGDQTIGQKSMTISKSKNVPILWNGEQKAEVGNSYGYETVYGKQIAQAMRALVNEMEADVALEAAMNCGTGLAVSGTSIFDTDLKDAAFARKLLVDNGAPAYDGQISLVTDTTGGANLRSLNNNVNEYGGDDVARRGIILPQNGVNIRESQQIAQRTGGTADSATLTAADYAVGDTVLTLASAGTGTILAGDFIAIAGHPYIYQVASGDAAMADGVTITLNTGLLQAITADSSAITVLSVGAAYTQSTIFHRDALELCVRAPKGAESDMATDRMTIVDPMSGLPFELSVYPQYRQTHIEVAAAWGFKAWKPEFIGGVIGA